MALNSCSSIKLLKYLIILSTVPFLIGCFPYSVPLLMINNDTKENIRDDWKSYGAYYEYDEFFLESSFSTVYIPFGGTHSTPVKQQIISRRLRILTKEGMQYATMNIPLLSNTIDEFYVKHTNANGENVSLDLYSLKNEYLKTGSIVVPKATAGSVIDVKIVYKDNGALTTYEHWFTRNIPVHKAKLTFSVYEKFEFAFKEYGGVSAYMYKPCPGKDDLTYYEWKERNILPRKSIAFQEPIDQSAPRVSATMRYAFDKPVYSTWAKLAENIGEELIEEPYTILDDYLDSLLLTFDFNNKTDEERAQLVLEWIQKNISINDYDEEYNPDYIIKDKSGTIWEIAVLCKELLKRLNLFLDIVMTRPSSLGGFDPAFVSPNSLMIPLVLTKIDRKVAYPYIYGGTLGQYPIGFFNQQGISLKKSEVVDLPAPLSSESKSEYTFSVDLEGDKSLHKLDAVLSGYAAYHYRSMIHDEDKNEIEEWFQDQLSDLNKSNRLDKFEIENENNFNKPLKFHMEFTNDEQIISRKGKSHFSLSHLFDSYFTSLDANRKTPFQYRINMHTIERVRFNKPKDLQITTAITNKEIENDLFQFNYKITEDDNSYEIQRELFINEGKIEPEKFPILINDILELNKLKSEYVIIN